jgi:hypothetical protein
MEPHATPHSEAIVLKKGSLSVQVRAAQDYGEMPD